MKNNIIGERIAGLLREQGKSQRKLAEQVGTTEVSMSRYIKGDRVPKGPILVNIAKALRTTTDYLLGNEQDSNDPELEYNYTQRAIARNANRWIPCTERLPEKSGRYLVTRGSNVSGSLWNKVDILNYSDLMGLKKEKIWWSGNVGKIDFEKCDHVIAWMPLPEPYEESENKENDSNESLEQQRVGKWIINKEYNGYETIIKDCKCPFCNEKALLKKSYSMDGQSIVLYPSNYCPNCGAKMEVEENG